MSASLGFSGALGKPPKPVSSPIKNSQRLKDQYLLEFPDHLLFDIFSRLSAKHIAKCRCVSKVWSSILRRQDFSELFLTVSSTRPRLLFALLHKNEWMFFSAPQALDLNSNSYRMVPSYHMSFLKGVSPYSYDEICAPVRGFVCSKTRKPVIYNPSTGEHLTLPRASENIDGLKTLLGYDPINKLYKVLCVSEDYSCRVSTLGTGEVNWRMIECSIPHKPLHAEISTDGVLYYLAERIGQGFSHETYMLVCFDVRLEKFKFIVVGLRFWCGTIINCKGKLGVIWPGLVGLNERTTRLELWVLEDVDEVKWSKIFYILPNNWKYIVDHLWIHIVGMTNADEIVFSTPYLNDSSYIVYYNVVKITLVRLEIQFKTTGMNAKYLRSYTFIDHVENVGLIDLIP